MPELYHQLPHLQLGGHSSVVHHPDSGVVWNSHDIEPGSSSYNFTVFIENATYKTLLYLQDDLWFAFLVSMFKLGSA